ncbi:HipA domain-containing protein [Myceligenerans crystallogenes]|uniref:Type II toxin-antitoxin system HipA family toxin n=1 Tax=Myceligenerans crystallogenes TaxID=316335 RepID=A0ABN2NG16_9MICO
MPDKQLDVYMDGLRAGAVVMTGAGALSFFYDDDYRSRPDTSPLSLSMPKAISRHKQRAVRPFLQGLLPDNDQALGAMAATHQVSARSPFAILQHVGHDVAGALQFIEPGGESEDAVADRKAVTPMSDEEVADDLRSVIDAYRTGRPVPAGGPLRMSLAGAQPKIALVRTADGAWARPQRGAPTTHILKPEYSTARYLADERFPDMTVVEMYSLAVTRHAGIPAPDARYWRSPDGDLRALVLERYDRHVGDDGLIHRDHQEDLCQALSVPPEKKYQHNDGGPGVGQIGELFGRAVAVGEVRQLATDFLALLTLNIALVNTDAHAKNYSLMLRGKSVSLAPAYDVLSIALYVDRDDPRSPLYFPMRIGNTYALRGIIPSAIAAEGVRLGLPGDEARDVVDSVLARVPAALELAREDVAEVPDGKAIADRIMTNLRKISPLYVDDAPIMLTSARL